ncbi:RCC1 and BTB domain-containing protein 2 [Hondaea fermentalgiana]|uniref:RCC1 and BTB domain-containing protein 2 n=1 Tax=Hondaea fermentalgiana TaxID=2315210 RepID=A0A2R5G7H7_9STRA|nr:RCC1 and BTB domain-containing protein 2 [Hondaea fermentalgiana]|eukprot:GBG26950.1 RCC1 and BTB domain-containing protein 2 [Hondaea fermentalgiana]
MGDGVGGRLGEDNAEDSSWVPLWHPTPILPSIRPSQVRQISCGAYHTAILEWDGSIHIFGVIGAEALAAQRASVLISSSIWGTPSRPRVEYIPTHLGHEPVQISSGTNTLAWTDVRGRVFVQDSRGLLRVNGFGEDADLGHAIQVSCGDCHFAVVTASGELYTWGGGGHGRLGHGDTLDRHVPTQVRVPGVLENEYERVRVVACEASYRHTAVVTSDGDLLLFGDGNHGQLGQTTLSEHLRPVRCTVGVLASTRVVQVACGETFTAALTEIGQVIVLGSLATQNAVARAQHVAYRLTAGPRDCAAVQIAAGKTSLLMRLDNGVVETCGRGRCGQLGQGSSVTLAMHAGAPHVQPFSSFWYQLATGKEIRFAANLGHVFARGIILVLNALGGHTLAAREDS